MTAAARAQAMPTESRRSGGPLIAAALVALYCGWWGWSKAFFDGAAPGVYPLHVAWAQTRVLIAPLACFAGFLLVAVAVMSGLRIFKYYIPAGIALMAISAALVGGIVYPYRRWLPLDTLTSGGHTYQLVGYSTGDEGNLYLYECDDSRVWCHSVYRFEHGLNPDLEGVSLIEGPAVQSCPEDSACGVLFEYEP